MSLPEQVIAYNRRRRLEIALVDSTKSLPQRCSIAKDRFKHIKNLIARKVPSDEAALAKDDIGRREAVLEIVAARVESGFDSKGQEQKWRHILDMERQGKHTLWQQRQYIVSTLEKRKDRERATIQERWSADSTGLQRLLTETLKEDDNGGIAPRHVHALRNALSSKNKGPSIRSRQQRREAVVYILRARRRVRLQGQPEISNEWGRIKLLPLIGVTKEELEEDVEMDYIHASIETDDPTIIDRGKFRHSRDLAPSPGPSTPPRQMECTPIPLSPLAFDGEESNMAEDGPSTAQRVYTPIPLSP